MITEDQLGILRDTFNEWDDSALERKISLHFESGRNLVIRIDDFDDEDFKLLQEYARKPGAES